MSACRRDVMRRYLSIDALWLLAILVGAFYLRVWYQLDTVLVGDTVRFTEVDAWHHMRLVDALVRDFPSRIHYDVYAVYGGQPIRTGPLLDLLVVGLALLLGRGAPSPHLVDLVGAWVPPILGTLAVLPIYALGRSLFGRQAGLWSAAIFAVLPGMLLQRTAFGFTDHHVLEVLFTPLVLLAVVRALRARVVRRIPESYSSTKSTNFWAAPSNAFKWLSSRSPTMRATYDSYRPVLGRSAAAGLALGAYLLSWTSGTFLLVILFVWIGLDLLCRAYCDETLEPPLLVGGVACAAGLPMVLVYASDIPGMELNAYALAAGVAATLFLGALAPGISKLPRCWRAPILFAALVLPLLVGALISPDARSLAIIAAGRLFPSQEWVGELQPLIAFGWGAGPWREYASAWPFAAAGLGMAVVLLVRTGSSALLLLLVYALVSVAATVGHIRFSLYLALAVALLGGLALARATAWKLPRWLSVPVLAGLVLIPTWRQALVSARQPNALTPAWYDALRWLGAHTPEPFADPKAYFQRFPPAKDGQPFAYPDSAYSIMAWWDYGHWIERIAHRIPVANPTQFGREDAARFLLASTPEEARPILDRVRSRYVIVNADLAAGSGLWKLDAIAAAADRQPKEFFERCWTTLPDGGLVEMPIYYPAYYQSMAVRLSVFAGQKVEPRDSTWLVTLEDRTDASGATYRVLASAQQFSTYDAAVQALPRFPGARIAGMSITASAVPLEQLDGFRKLYDSKEREVIASTRLTAPLIRIFEYNGR